MKKILQVKKRYKNRRYLRHYLSLGNHLRRLMRNLWSHHDRLYTEEFLNLSPSITAECTYINGDWKWKVPINTKLPNIHEKNSSQEGK